MKPLAPHPQTRGFVLSVGASTALGVLTLLTTLPALAADPFTVKFDPIYGTTNPPNGTGSKAEATFTITKTASNVFVDIFLKNTTVYPPTQSTLVGLAFVTPEYLTFASPIFTKGSTGNVDYNYGQTDFTDLFPGDFLSGGPFGNRTYDFCLRSEGGSNCNGGQPLAGLTAGQDAQSSVIFKFSTTSTKSDVDIAKDFIALYADTPQNATNRNIGARFQDTSGCIDLSGNQVTCPATSDKVGGVYIPPTVKPPLAPGESVPGPLPLFGAAAAFGYSRKLRQRLKVTSMLN